MYWTYVKQNWRLASLALAAALTCPLAGVAQESDDRDATNRPQNGQEDDQQNNQSAEDSQAAGQENNDGEEEVDQSRQEDQVKQLKVFTLKHCRPGDVRQLMSIRFDPHGDQYENVARPGATTVGYRGTDFLDDVAIATDDNANLLFVRGPEKKIKELEQLVKAIDVPAAELKEQSLGQMQVIPVQGDRAREIDRILADLQLDTQTVMMGDLRLIIVPTGDSDERTQNLEQVKAVVSRLSDGGGQNEGNRADDAAEGHADTGSASQEEDRTAQNQNES